MNTEFTKAAEKIFYFIGSKENILSVGNCVTRLRLILKDNRKVNIGALKSVQGVLGIVEISKQLQIIIDSKKAERLISEFVKIYEINS